MVAPSNNQGHVGYGCFFIAVTMPFLGSLAGLTGGIALPVTSAYPCFLWLKVKKPRVYSQVWCLNQVLELLGMGLSGILIAAEVYVVFDTGIKVSFFNHNQFTDGTFTVQSARKCNRVFFLFLFLFFIFTFLIYI